MATISAATAAAAILPEKMGGRDPVPIEIGARGTVGNLVMKEIEYFKKLELGRGDHDNCSRRNFFHPDKKHGGDGGGSNFWPSFGFLNVTWRRAKRKGGGGGSSGRFLPRMCTVVDVAESRHHNHHRLSKIPSFGYRNLKDDIDHFEV
ncbi:uncharacterized protein LOC112522823 [Cynara cardunculus var. scolymus]|uniref:Uncharacterized protein n=1 Tax=Cynara cardunculus var. scolymus TaxID=59895 RepID=A0A103XV11_CYNCS|nr:uncharacterized protein LOC112522823 [Cynara cardunculus var. scolymus]KVH97393.1 hypothetical protein Ccrd_000498 [Cynara cardunculus var. scolymus]